MILKAAARWNVSPALLAGQQMAESGFDPNAGSPAGAAGDRPVHAEHRSLLRARRTPSTRRKRSTPRPT